MSTSNKPENCPWLMPMLTVKDVLKSLDFYEQAFGFERGMTMPDEQGTLAYADMLYKGMQVIMMMPEGAWGNQTKTPATSTIESAVTLYVYCDDVDGDGYDDLLVGSALNDTGNTEAGGVYIAVGQQEIIASFASEWVIYK